MGSAEAGSGETFETVYGDVAAWVDDYFARVFGDSMAYRPGDQLNWCPEWWRHPSAAIRLDALWRVWEGYRHEGGLGISAWFLDHADPHMRALVAVNGPFRRCSIERGHRDTVALPTAAPDQRMFFSGDTTLWERPDTAAPQDPRD